jgi:hypothetical protein
MSESSKAAREAFKEAAKAATGIAIGTIAAGLFKKAAEAVTGGSKSNPKTKQSQEESKQQWNNSRNKR